MNNPVAAMLPNTHFTALPITLLHQRTDIKATYRQNPIMTTSQDHQLNLRVSRQLWDRFVEAAHTRAQTPSSVLRAFMAAYSQLAVAPDSEHLDRDQLQRRVRTLEQYLSQTGQPLPLEAVETHDSANTTAQTDPQ